MTQQAERQWTRHRHRTLAGKTVGGLGVGQIATSLAKRLRAFDMSVIGFSSSDGRHDPTFDVLPNRIDLLVTAPQLDFLVVLVPFSPATKHIVNAGVLGAMKPSAFVINLARGGVLEESALALCLHEGRIAGAALDVFAHEPLPPDSELWDCPNLLITPHVGANCDDYAKRASPIVVENVRQFLDGADARSLLNYVRGRPPMCALGAAALALGESPALQMPTSATSQTRPDYRRSQRFAAARLSSASSAADAIRVTASPYRLSTIDRRFLEFH